MGTLWLDCPTLTSVVTHAVHLILVVLLLLASALIPDRYRYPDPSPASSCEAP
jgi:hypothetical protein